MLMRPHQELIQIVTRSRAWSKIERSSVSAAEVPGAVPLEADAVWHDQAHSQRAGGNDDADLETPDSDKRRATQNDQPSRVSGSRIRVYIADCRFFFECCVQMLVATIPINTARISLMNQTVTLMTASNIGKVYGQRC